MDVKCVLKTCPIYLTRYTQLLTRLVFLLFVYIIFVVKYFILCCLVSPSDVDLVSKLDKIIILMVFKGFSCKLLLSAYSIHLHVIHPAYKLTPKMGLFLV